ncbi:hypothetical protein W97_05191 [Coniosporium apollinis CBS 100218]|uniref:Cation efflux protein transmembrane domain-containing protein n=1 Tax=Coniosporium apollinis (strain CBS 100218) TaxID=1168221 RepID=R7YVV9_CONA1|nr:uncharacterized protein W97_05191 [Coniosporium apollinis CBS 100218]EON65949.1 hypothetical protein W97_05191 [Coniosporium apollinis CBS 100218]
MADASSPPNLVRLGSLKNFLSLSEDPVLHSTRGQHLPALLHNLSSQNLSVDSEQYTRRPSSLRSEARYERQNSDDTDLELGRTHSAQTGRVSSEERDRRTSSGAAALMTPQMRSQRLIGNSNPRYRWEQYWKTEEELKKMSKPLRQYYERNNYLIQQYSYIDRLLDSSLPHSLLQEYNQPYSGVDIPSTIVEEPRSTPTSPDIAGMNGNTPGMESIDKLMGNEYSTKSKIKRTPKDLYKVPDEERPLLEDDDTAEDSKPNMPQYEPEESSDSSDRIVTVAIYLNLVANTTLLILKIIVAVLTDSLSVLASLVDAALDFLSTAIVWTTTRLISRRDQYSYPVGRRRLEPIGVLVFSVIMITSFFQVALEGINRLRSSGDHTLVQLTIPATAIMASTVVIKFLCWLWCRFIKNSSVQALAQDAMTDVVFNIFSIIFPLVGYYAKVWWLDSLGGILLSIYVILNWSRTSSTHIRNLTGAAASADERNVLLYLTMRFAKTIKQIQGLQAYHAGDKLNVEVDVVLDENTSLRDSHDLGESLQYVLESVPTVDRAFVHLDYAGWNLPSHMQQQD